jgi:hypothetical protein
MTPLFAFLDDAKQSIMQFVNNCLLVAGAFLVGYILGGLIGWALGKWALKQKSPDTLKQIGRPLGGILLALIVALLVFTGMGKRVGLGGDGRGTPDESGDKESRAKIDPTDPRVNMPKVDQSLPEVTVRVMILAGTAVRTEGKYYLFDDDKAAKSLPELKEAVNERKAKAKGKTVLQILFSPDPNLAPPRNDPKVTDVTRWATEEAGLDVTFPASR